MRGDMNSKDADDEFQEVDDFQEVPEGEEFEVVEAPEEVPEEMPEEPPPPPPAADFQVVTTSADVTSMSTSERLDIVESALKDVTRKIEEMEKSGEAMQHDINTVKETLSHIDANMRELTSLYDLVSSQVNPFIETEVLSAKAKEEAEGEEEGIEFEAVFEPTPQMETEEELTPAEQMPPPTVEVVPTEGVAVQQPIMAPPPPPGVAPVQVTGRPLKVARLTQIGSESTCLIALMRWIEFMLSKVKREHIPSLLSFYVRIGWISEGIRQHILDVIRGIRFAPEAPVTPGAAPPTHAYEAPRDKEGDVIMAYRKETMHELPSEKGKEAKSMPHDDWKLTPEDHLKSLIFIERIRGGEIDKSKLEELERDILNLRRGLDGFFGL